MRKAQASRFSILFLILAAGALGLCRGGVSGQDAAVSTGSRSEARSNPEKALRWVVVVRHAEKDSIPESDPPLSPRGEARAEALRHFLEASPVTALFATNTRRAERTLAPISEATGLLIDLADRDDPYGTVDRVLQGGGTFSVVSAHSDTVPLILAGLTGDDSNDWGPIRYDDLFLVALPPAGEPTVLRLRYGEPDA